MYSLIGFLIASFAVLYVLALSFLISQKDRQHE